jgi:nicotinamidase-related amidase
VDQACGRNCRILLEGMAALGVPTLISRQYPQGLGDTLPELQEAAGTAPVLDKTTFSSWEDEALRSALEGDGRKTVVIAGIEAHVCVLATVDDLCREGFRVIVAADAVASRKAENAEWARAAMTGLGAVVVPTESILFRLQRVAGGPVFKTLSRLVK